MNQVTHHDFGSFETELLSVDFISFNIKRITSHQITCLASYFQNLGFNAFHSQIAIFENINKLIFNSWF